MSTPSEVVVATTTTTTDLVSERVCLDQGGSYMLEAEAESENASSGFLTFDDSSEEGSTSPQHCDLLGGLWLAGSAAFVKVLTVVQFWELWHNRWRGDREPECGWESD